MGKKTEKKKKVKWWMVALALVFLAIISSSGKDDDEVSKEMPTPEPTVEATSTSEPTSTPAPTSTPIPTEEPTATNTPKPTSTPKPTNTPKPTATSTPTPTPTVKDYINGIVDAYNDQAAEMLIFDEDFTPSDKSSGHYRTEFRLAAFKDAIGKSYLLGGKVVDLVAYESNYGKVYFRAYTTDASLEQVKALVQGMSPLLDATLSQNDLESAVQKIETDKKANGYCYGELAITLLGNDAKGYELMIKKE